MSTPRRNNASRRVARAVATCAFATCAAAALVLPVSGQVYRVNGGFGTTEGNEGASLARIEDDSVTSFGVGAAQGVRFGFRREIDVGNSSLAAGDSVVSLRLLTDLDAVARFFVGRGLLLHASPSARTTLTAFAGFTGANFSNAYFSSVASTRPIGMLDVQFPLSRNVVADATLLTGARNSLLLSARVQKRVHDFFAVTAGVSGGSPVLRTAAHVERATRRLDASYTVGQMNLQPKVSDQNVLLERTGLNVTASQSFRQWLLLDAGRSEYRTAGISGNPLYSGVTADHSALIEAGATLHFNHVQAGTRFLRGASGATGSKGSVVIGGWSQRRWNVLAIAVRNASVTTETIANHLPATKSSSLMLQGSQRFWQRFSLEETLNVGGGSGVSVGGSYEGDRFAISVGNRETYVPFGNKSGFHQVMSFQLRLRTGNAETTGTLVRGGGLPSVVTIGTDGFYGSFGAGAAATGHSHFPALPKYVVRGTVRDQEGAALRGAAVQIGDQIAITDSEGQFSARFATRAPLRVSLDPSQFVTAQRYRSDSPEMVVKPDLEAEPLLLTARRCSQCGAEEPANIATQQQEEGVEQGPMRRAGETLRILSARLFRFGKPNAK